MDSTNWSLLLKSMRSDTVGVEDGLDFSMDNPWTLHPYCLDVLWDIMGWAHAEGVLLVASACVRIQVSGTWLWQ